MTWRIGTPFSRWKNGVLTISEDAIRNDCSCWHEELHGQTSRERGQWGLLWRCTCFPTHVLSASQRSSIGNIYWVSIGSHYFNGTDDGEHIKVIAIINNPDHFEGSSDYVVLELEKPNSFKPVKLASADDSGIKQDEMATAMGWSFIAESDPQAMALQGLNVELWSNENCSQIVSVNQSMVCAGGIRNEDACSGDTGGPLIIPSPNGSDSDDVLIGSASWGYGCGRRYPGVYSRVSYARSWIDPIISGTCFV